MAALNALLFKPLRGVLKKRRETVDGSHQKARDLEAGINEKMARYQEQLQAAKIKGNQEKAGLRQQAAEQESQILAQARDEATTSLKTIKARVAEEAKGAREALQAESQVLAGQIASKVLGRAL